MKLIARLLVLSAFAFAVVAPAVSHATDGGRPTQTTAGPQFNRPPGGGEWPPHVMQA